MEVAEWCSDYDGIINCIFELTRQIYNSYVSLVNNETVEGYYKADLIEKSKDLIRLEDLLYDDLKLDPTIARELMLYVVQTLNMKIDRRDVMNNIIYSNDPQTMLALRVLKHLEVYGNKNDNLNKVFCDNNLVMDKYLMDYFETSTVKNQVLLDVERAFLYYIESEIDNFDLTEDSAIAFRDLVEIKYNLIFLEPEIEKEVISNSLDNPSCLVLSYLAIGKKYMDNYGLFKKTASMEAYKNCYKAINAIFNRLSSSDPDFCDNDPIYLANKAYLKATLVVLNGIDKNIDINENNNDEQNINDGKSYDNVMKYVSSVASNNSDFSKISNIISDIVDEAYEEEVFYITDVKEKKKSDD